VNPTSGRSFSALAGRSAPEIISLKYENRVRLSCELRLSESGAIDLAAPASKKIEWDYPFDPAQLKIMNYRNGKEDFVIVLRLEDPIEVRDAVTHVTEDGREYYMEHTPVLRLLYRRAHRRILQNGGVHERQTYLRRSLFENVQERLFTISTDTWDRRTATEDLRCKLETRAPPPYLDQWERVR
jgi:hypothetical protein